MKNSKHRVVKFFKNSVWLRLKGIYLLVGVIFCGFLFADDVSTNSLTWSPFYSTNYYPIGGLPGQAQGVATDGTNIYTFHNKAIVKTLKTPGIYTPVASNYSPQPDGGLFNHLLDAEYDAGKLYGATMYWDNSSPTSSSNSCLVVWDAGTLAVESYVFISNKMAYVTALTIAPDLNRVFVIGGDDAGLIMPKMFLYAFDTMEFIEEITLSRPVFHTQDLEYKDGTIYAVTDNARGAGMVYAITTNGVISDRPQMFSTPQGHESEGIDISGNELLYYPAGSTNVYVFPQIEKTANEQRSPAGGLRLHYAFDETNSTFYTADRSSFGNHGFFSKMAERWFADGLQGGGYQGAGGRYFSVQGESVSGWSNITINVWVKYSSGVASRERIISKLYSNSEGEWYFDVFSDTSIAAGVKNANGVLKAVVGTTRQIGDGKWHMLTTIYDGTNITVYFDSELVNSGAHTGAIISKPYLPIQVGGYNVFNHWNFRGTMDELKVWNRALSPHEISAELQNYSSLTNITASRQDVVFNWHTVIGQSYALESSTNLVNWIPILSGLIGTNENFTFKAELSSEQRFFRFFPAP